MHFASADAQKKASGKFRALYNYKLRVYLFLAVVIVWRNLPRLLR